MYHKVKCNNCKGVMNESHQTNTHAFIIHLECIVITCINAQGGSSFVSKYACIFLCSSVFCPYLLQFTGLVLEDYYPPAQELTRHLKQWEGDQVKGECNASPLLTTLNKKKGMYEFVYAHTYCR